MLVPVSRNALCSCGSGKRYKHCCEPREAGWESDPAGRYFRRVWLPADILALHEVFFFLTYGRPPRRSERSLGNARPLAWIEQQTAEAMQRVGIDPALIFAYERTGLLVTERNEPRYAEGDIAEWEAALDEYERNSGQPVAGRRLTDEELETLLAQPPAGDSPTT